MDHHSEKGEVGLLDGKEHSSPAKGTLQRCPLRLFELRRNDAKDTDDTSKGKSNNGQLHMDHRLHLGELTGGKWRA